MEAPHPDSFRAAVFTRAGGKLEFETVKWRNPGQGGKSASFSLARLRRRQIDNRVVSLEAVIEVLFCGINSSDEIQRFGLLPPAKFPRTPGCCVVGVVVKVGPPPKRSEGHCRCRPGMRIVSVFDHQGLAEYCTGRTDASHELTGEKKALDGLIACYDAARILSSYERFSHEQKKKDKNEHTRCLELFERMGMKGEGVICVYGEGGYARLALEILGKTTKTERILLVTYSVRFSADDYGIDKRDMLVVGKQNVGQALRKLGGAKLVIAADQPRDGTEEVLDGMRYGSELLVLNPRKDHPFQLPLANLLAKNLQVHGAPSLDCSAINRSLDFCSKHNLTARVAPFDFNEAGVNAAWEHMEDRGAFDAPVVVF
ncbi:hypothetical protein JCM21900_000341 [Sporobolomyces salmonicolor]